MLQDTISSTKESSSIIPPFSSKSSNAKTSLFQFEDENSVSVHTTMTYKKPSSALPIIEQNLSRDDIIKQGLVLCTRMEEWYRTTSKNIVDVELRERKQSWRQFHAILTKNRLELYHITTTKIRRRAHMIELTGKYGHAKLSILSHIDYIWGLECVHTKKKQPIVFHFQSSNLPDAQEWYMTLYQLLLLPKTKMIGKAPLPPFVDLIIPEMDHFVIHVPLYALLTNDQQISSAIYNIRMHDLKLAALRMLDSKGIKPSNWAADNVGLCWTLDFHKEWVTENQNALLVGPQLIEQKHKLELWCFGDQEICSSEEPFLDGILKPWKWSTKAQTAVDQNMSEIYAILAGHFLFQVDISHYNYKMGMELSSKKSWFTSANGLLQKENKPRKNEKIRHNGQSASISYISDSSVDTEPRSVLPLKYAKQMLDLSRVETVDVVQNSKENNLFRIGVNGGCTLCYQANTSENMMEWIRVLTKEKQHYDEYHSQIPALIKAESNLWHEFCRNHQIVKSNVLYVSNNKLFNKMLCILTNEKELLLYDRFKRKRWNGEPIPEPLYKQNYHLKLDDDVYIYSGSESFSDHQKIVKRQQVEPARHYIDGLVTEKMRSSDCYFIIWFRTSKSRFVYTRDCISLFKTGHHLGEPGRYLIFKTRNKAERDSWVWALHQEYGTNVL